MYTLGLLVAGVALLLLLGRREHLAFTDNVKEIPRTIDPAEEARIFEFAPASLQKSATDTGTALKYTPDKSKSLVTNIVRDFLRMVYIPATAPITEEVITAHVNQQTQTFSRGADTASSSPIIAFYRNAYSNGDAKQLIEAYLGMSAGAPGDPTKPNQGKAKPGGAPPPPTPGAGGVSVPRVLDQMRDALLEYKMTGKSEYKASYDGLKAWMDRYISTLTTQLNRDADRITTDVDAYRTANPDIAKIQTEFQRVAREGPEVENTYLTIKKQMDQSTTTDYSGLYVKGGIALGLVIAAAVLSFA